MRPRARRGWGWLVLSSVALAAGAAGPPRPAAAHAIIVESAPRHREAVAAPRRLVLRFNSRIEKRLSSARLTGADRKRVTLVGHEADTPPDTLAYPLPDLRPGSYRLHWKVLAVDGHVTEGVLVFTVTDR